MKISSFIITIILFFSFQNLSAQTINSSITVKKKNGTYFVSGIVPDEQIKNQVIEIIKNQGAGNLDANNLKVNNNAGYLSSNWQAKFTKQISKVKNSKTAFVQFKSDPNDYPQVAEELLNSEITLVNNGGKIKLSDYRDDLIILTFVAEWSRPDRVTISELNKLHSENLKNLRIIAVSVDEMQENKTAFEKFVQQTNIKFQTGWADKNFIKRFVEISISNAIPLTFVIKNGKMRGVFIGASPKVNENLINLVRKISNE